jgi:peptidoglycan hydrolase CwlO-like protein
MEKKLALAVIIVAIIFVGSCMMCVNNDNETQPTEKGETITIPIDEHRQLEIDVDKWNQDVEKYEKQYYGR